MTSDQSIPFFLPSSMHPREPAVQFYRTVPETFSVHLRYSTERKFSSAAGHQHNDIAQCTCHGLAMAVSKRPCPARRWSPISSPAPAVHATMTLHRRRVLLLCFCDIQLGIQDSTHRAVPSRCPPLKKVPLRPLDQRIARHIQLGAVP